MPEIPTGIAVDPAAAVRAAAGILDAHVPEFLARQGAPALVRKSGYADFATAADRDLEQVITAQLQGATGVAVHGEEFGGPDPTRGTVWALDPIDGTFNYSTGSPLCAMLLGLLHDGQPVGGLCWIPALGTRLHATVAGPVRDGETELPPLARTELRDVAASAGTLNARRRGRYPGPWCYAVAGRLAAAAGGLRHLGTSGVEQAWVARAGLGVAINYGGNVWDNAAGAALVLAAGGVVTDAEGLPWHAQSPSLVAGAPGAAEAALDILTDPQLRAEYAAG